MTIKDINKDKSYLITGAAGFIGSFLAKRLLKEGCKVIGIDNINDYYDINLKDDRLEELKSFTDFTFIK
ncbi:MAG: GDP-mannose 4,6-dehydratase, partial [Halanaerobiales bacterium]